MTLSNHGRLVSARLPYPPSVNSYWRHIARGPLAGRVLLSAKGRAYRESVRLALNCQGIGQPMLDGRLSVHIRVCAPDRRVRDLDNTLKGLLDSLKHCGVIEDDGNIDELYVRRGEVTKPGHMDLVLTLCATETRQFVTEQDC